MTIKIDQKIRSVSVLSQAEVQANRDAEQASAAAAALAAVVHMHENIRRPDVLVGATYKIKSPSLDHAMYVTINDIVLNEGTAHEQRRPFEIFINSKAMDQFQWIVALTRIMSAVFRKGGDIVFLVEELKAIFDPKGGYFQPGGRFMPSLIAEIGTVVEKHLTDIGMLHPPQLSPQAKALIASKRAQLAAIPTNRPAPPQPGNVNQTTAAEPPASFPATATMCHKCSNKSVIIMDGCATCLNCGYSKCG